MPLQNRSVKPNPGEIKGLLVCWPRVKGKSSRFDIPFISPLKKFKYISQLLNYLMTLPGCHEAKLSEGNYILKLKYNDWIIGSHHLPLQMKFKDAMKALNNPETITIKVITQDKYTDGNGHFDNPIYQVNFLRRFINENGEAKMPINLHSGCLINRGRLGQDENSDPNNKLNKVLFVLECGAPIKGSVLLNINDTYNAIQPPSDLDPCADFEYHLEGRINKADFKYKIPRHELLAQLGRIIRHFESKPDNDMLYRFKAESKRPSWWF